MEKDRLQNKSLMISSKEKCAREKAFRPPPYVFANEPLPTVNRLYPQLPVMQGPAVEFRGEVNGVAEVNNEIEQKFGHMINKVYDAVKVMSRRLDDIQGGSRTRTPQADISENRPHSNYAISRAMC